MYEKLHTFFFLSFALYLLLKSKCSNSIWTKYHIIFFLIHAYFCICITTHTSVFLREKCSSLNVDHFCIQMCIFFLFIFILLFYCCVQTMLCTLYGELVSVVFFLSTNNGFACVYTTLILYRKQWGILNCYLFLSCNCNIIHFGV